MATEASRSSTSSADSYIGSLISLTSKSEIRYEGILYNINTEESSIGLRNVRSFGTEGRKKDGPQLMPSDKVYEYILFRGSDIKDLQVKSSLPAQPTQPINNDPAIIQNPQMGHPGSTLQGGPPLYQPNESLGSWGSMPPPPNVNSTGLPMPPMYWPGFYAPPNGLPQLHQQSLLRPPLSLQQPMQYPSYNPSLPGGPPIQLPKYPPSVSTTDNLPSFMQSNPLNSVGHTAPVVASLQSLSLLNTSDANSTIPPVSNKPSVPSELPTPSLVTPGQLLQSVGPTSQFTHVVHKDVEVVQVSQTPARESAPASEPSVPVVVPVPVPVEAQPPILPLPPQSRIAPKTNGASYQNRQSYNYRGRERGRGYGGSQSVMKFTEEFDFNAMNEKFNKDEIWGTLGKTNRKENDGNASDEDEYEDENAAADLAKVDVKPVYSKDDFFDTLSCNSLDKQSSNGRPRFSELMKLDTETFGEFSRYRGGRGGRGPYRGGRTRGGGYHGRGGGYYGRGRGGGRTPNATHDY